MTKGIRSYANKQRRKIRRENHFARDLKSPIFRQRKIDRNKDYNEKYSFNFNEWTIDED